MKRHLFTIAEGYFYALVKHVTEHFDDAFKKSGGTMLVGGLAVQLHIMDMTIKAGLSPDCSHFRKTDDIDIALYSAKKSDIEVAVSALPVFEAEVGSKIVVAEVIRTGAARPVIHLTVIDDPMEISEEVKLNMSSGPTGLHYINNGYHSDSFSRRTTISFPHVSVDGQASFQVIGLEDLLITKLVNGREKDIKDVNSIAQVAKATKRELDTALMDETIGRCVPDAARKQEAKERYRAFLQRLKKGRPSPPKGPLKRTVR